jgi:hypothetical protein
MESEGLITSFRQHEKIYYLAKKGRDVIGVDKEVVKNSQVDHYLMRGDIYIYVGCPKDFKVEFEYHFKGAINQNGIVMKKDMFVRSDGYFLKNNVPCFVEVDNTQSMKENRIKLERYKQLTHYLGSHVTPVIVFYTLSETRQQKLKQYAKELGVKCHVYTKRDIR